MNRADIKTELDVILHDPSVSSSFDSWINDELDRLSYQFDFPQLRLKTPASLTTNNTTWQYNLTAATHASSYVFQKKLWKWTNDLFETGGRIDTDIQIIDEIDPDHNDIGDDVQRIAYELDGRNNAILATWPMATDVLSLWFYRKPTALTADTQFPDFLPDEHVSDVLIPRIVLRAFRLYPEIAAEIAGDNTRALALWEAKYQAGLYGSNGRIGLIDTLRKSKPVRQRGPRPGMGLAGADRFAR